jgi:hypothetical protein
VAQLRAVSHQLDTSVSAQATLATSLSDLADALDRTV